MGQIFGKIQSPSPVLLVARLVLAFLSLGKLSEFCITHTQFQGHVLTCLACVQLVISSSYLLHLPIHAARVKMGQIFAKVIQSRRSSTVKEEDVLQQFCDARYQNVLGGRQLTEEEITGLLIAVLFAGQHTSSITSSWTGYFMIDSKVGVHRSQAFRVHDLVKESVLVEECGNHTYYRPPIAPYPPPTYL